MYLIIINKIFKLIPIRRKSCSECLLMKLSCQDYLIFQDSYARRSVCEFLTGFKLELIEDPKEILFIKINNKISDVTLKHKKTNEDKTSMLLELILNEL